MIGRIAKKALDVVQGRKPLVRPLDPHVAPSPTVRNLTGRLGRDRLSAADNDFVTLAGLAATALRRDWPGATGALRAQAPELLASLRDRIKARSPQPWQERIRHLKTF